MNHLPQWQVQRLISACCRRSNVQPHCHVNVASWPVLACRADRPGFFTYCGGSRQIFHVPCHVLVARCHSSWKIALNSTTHFSLMVTPDRVFREAVVTPARAPGQIRSPCWNKKAGRIHATGIFCSMASGSAVSVPIGFLWINRSQVTCESARPPSPTISPREIVKNDLKRRQWASRRLKSTVTSERFGAVAQARVRTMPVR